MTIKRIARLALTILLAACCAFGTAFAADDDVTGHWSEPYFRSLSAHGVINANGRGQFTPSAEISRAEFMRYINRAFGFTETADISQYTDVGEDQWYYESVCIAVKYGYISGLSDTEMAPNTSITREQAVTILGRLCKAEVGSVTPSQLSFSDKSSVAAWSAPYIQWALENNYVSGYTDGTFQPKRGVTRAEAAKILYFFTGSLLDQSGAIYNSSSLNQDTKNVTVTSACTLSDVTIPGNLYISEGINQSAVTLTNVTVQGRLIAAGGTLLLSNVTANELYISSPFTDRSIGITASGTTSVGKVTVMSAATLTQSSVQASGLGPVQVYSDQNAPLVLSGRFSSVTLNGQNRLTLSSGSYVDSLTVKGAATIDGLGTIQNAVFEAAGAVSAVEPQNYSFNQGASATIQGAPVSTDRNQPTSSTQGQGAASNSGTTVSGGSAGLVTQSVTFSNTAGNAANRNVTIDLRIDNSVVVQAVLLDGAQLTMGTDYTISGTQVVLYRASLDTLTAGHTGTMQIALLLSNGGQLTVPMTLV